MINQPRGELVPGGLAMIIGSIHGESGYIGTTVTLVERFHCQYGAAWRTDPVPSGACVALEKHLMPINPSADPLEITQQREEKV